MSAPPLAPPRPVPPPPPWTPPATWSPGGYVSVIGQVPFPDALREVVITPNRVEFHY
jgi:hypothetical protein